MICSRVVALLGVGRTRLSEGRLVTRAPASNRVRMEVGHCVGIVAVNCQAIADVDVAVVPGVGV